MGDFPIADDLKHTFVSPYLFSVAEIQIICYNGHRLDSGGESSYCAYKYSYEVTETSNARA